MVDVNVHKCFPTIIYEFEYEAIDKHLMESYIIQVRKNHKYHTDDDLHVLSYFARLRDMVKEVSRQYLDDLEYEYDSLENTGMWANKLFEGDSHPPHTH